MDVFDKLALCYWNNLSLIPQFKNILRLIVDYLTSKVSNFDDTNSDNLQK